MLKRVATPRSIKQSDEELRRSQERFAAIFRASPVAIIIRSLVDGRFRDVNDHFLEMTGYTREEVVGRTPSEVGLWAGLPEDDHNARRGFGAEPRRRVPHQDRRTPAHPALAGADRPGGGGVPPRVLLRRHRSGGGRGGA